jgi:hypothetical protein
MFTDELLDIILVSQIIIISNTFKDRKTELNNQIFLLLNRTFSLSDNPDGT